MERKYAPSLFSPYLLDQTNNGIVAWYDSIIIQVKIRGPIDGLEVDL